MRFWHFVLLLGALCMTTSLLLRFRPAALLADHTLIATSYTYMGPNGSAQDNPKLIQIQIHIRDSVEPSGPEVTRAAFNNQTIRLQPRDIYGNRGSASFQLEPGTYKLQWTVDLHKSVWPRTVDHEQQVMVSPRDLWVQVQIDGEQASIQ